MLFRSEGSKALCIDAVIWKTAFATLRFKPQEGLEVIVTGRVTTFPGKSKYQIVDRNLQPAGVGALMALLEERRQKLTAEGLFDLPARAHSLSAGRHRRRHLADRRGDPRHPSSASRPLPRHVLVWPVRVQGEQCADEVAAAIAGSTRCQPAAIAAPEVIIVARGGGSIEDLWGFNEEIVVRAAAESVIPLISAVGHETDVTLIDYAADVRAPTPTAAAEKAVPVQIELLAALADLARRRMEAMLRGLERRRTDLRSAARALPTPEALFAAKRQRLDLAAAKLAPGFARNTRDCEARLARTANALSRHSPTARLAAARARLNAADGRPRLALIRLTQGKAERLTQMGHRLRAARDALARAERLRLQQRRDRAGSAAQRLAVGIRSQFERMRTGLAALSQLFESLNYKAVLARGYALVRDADGDPVSSAAAVHPAQALAIEFADGIVRTTADGPRPKRRVSIGVVQGSLFEA